MVDSTRFIFVTGGVASSLGKGLLSASLGALIQACGLTVRLRKLDPYLNVDPGTMSPTQHGEIYVTEDGAEADLDLGHYERYTGVAARRGDSITAGLIYQRVIERERRGDYLGVTVQVIPHVTDAIREAIFADTKGLDFVICEIGGTVGDIESLPFLEAVRQIGNHLGPKHSLFIHMTWVPYLPSAGEIKTKLTQHSVSELARVGIRPDLLLCRLQNTLTQEAKDKIALFCNLDARCVIEVPDIDNVYELPLKLHDNGLDTAIRKHFNLKKRKLKLDQWHKIVKRVQKPSREVTIALIGKYNGFKDSYKSLLEALNHGAIAHGVRINLSWQDAEIFEKNREDSCGLENAHAILVPGGFGSRGAEGKVNVARHARRLRVPYLGICLGMQTAVIETARLSLPGVNSTEFDPCCETPVVGLIQHHHRGQFQSSGQNENLGGTMRLGNYECDIVKDSLAYQIYGTQRVRERHRHRYEIDLTYRESLENAGLRFSGMSPDGKLPEIIERNDHPWFIGVQFHPELRSRPFDPHPLFHAFVKVAIDQARSCRHAD